MDLQVFFILKEQQQYENPKNHKQTKKKIHQPQHISSVVQSNAPKP